MNPITSVERSKHFPWGETAKVFHSIDRFLTPYKVTRKSIPKKPLSPLEGETQNEPT